MPRLTNKKFARKAADAAKAKAWRKPGKAKKRAPAVSLEQAEKRMNGALDRSRNP